MSVTDITKGLVYITNQCRRIVAVNAHGAYIGTTANATEETEMIDDLKVTPKQWIIGFSKACQMNPSPIRTRYVQRLIATAPDRACKGQARELLK